MCACFGSSLRLFYISSDLLFSLRDMNFFFSCVIILLVNSWSKPGADTRKLGLQSKKRTGAVCLSSTGQLPCISELSSPNHCKATNTTDPPLLSPALLQGLNCPYMQHAVSPAPPVAMAKQVPTGLGGHHMGCLCNQPPSLLSSPAPPRITF